MSSEITRAIVKTLSYSDVFNYPLCLSEIKKYLVGYSLSRKNMSAKLAKTIKSVPVIKEKHGFFFFIGREKIISIRRNKKIFSIKKMSYARHIAGMLFNFPTIKLIAVTGSLAVMASDSEDDIDLLIVSAKNRIWLTRFFCVLFLKIIRAYRQPKRSKAPDKICLNMYMDDSHMTLPIQERDLYSAHEIVQMKVIFAKPGFENILHKKNLWYKKYLPNAFGKAPRNETKSGSNYHIFSFLFDFIENLLKKFQLFYMSRRRTSEVIRDGYLRFHPQDAREEILKSYKKNLKTYRSYTS